MGGKSENKKKSHYGTVSSAETPSGVEDLMKVYERFQEAYSITQQYLELISPKTHQSNSNQSFVTESREDANVG